MVILPRSRATVSGAVPRALYNRPISAFLNGGEVAETYDMGSEPSLRIVCGVAGGTKTRVPSDSTRSSPPTVMTPRPRVMT
jgi:hypothetical protein